ncbi:2-keto-4-pentenoate hydratase [Acidaminobacter hydrogenoformans]|uniref:2-keto-4-pentenoate hydratase n=1 Tax=Acidaminobacter hydrogenoformans DSM 2784 TaxID=1120920 RepID=A0A1G5RXI6_9FIRM|nr:fumarylacetoacetate hydrolase family protein [Acidaminobacter hydrogenoformans]SCZ78568.1 2-keto-4-pentenoate hydratase [Acidaminobacter hydrogenoformans DSM 2784]
MAVENGTFEKIASELLTSERTCKPIQALSARYPELTIEDAYQIQKINIDEKLASGDVITGKKIGLTSLVMQKMLGVNQPDFGYLLKSMEVKNGATDRKTMLQPKAEGEIAFILKEDLMGPNLTPQDVINATDYVVAAIEIVDSRVENWKINIIDTVSDNASSGRYILSDIKVDPKTVDLKSLKMEFWKNGEKINEGKGEDALGDPAYAIAWLGNTLGSFGVPLRKGEVIFSGALSAALNAESGDVFTAKFESLGDIELKFE